MSCECSDSSANALPVRRQYRNAQEAREAAIARMGGPSCSSSQLVDSVPGERGNLEGGIRRSKKMHTVEGRRAALNQIRPQIARLQVRLRAPVSSFEINASPVQMLWSYGVTTVPGRRETLLPKTLASLAAAGFEKPRLFVDGCDELQNWRKWFGLEVTCRYPVTNVAVNWILSLAELVQRDPNADRFAIFQDDFVTYRNLRGYLEHSPYPEKGYLNLVTQYENEDRARGKKGWFPASLGRGAVALVFNREAAAVLLSERGLIERSQDRVKGVKSIDGGIFYAMQKQGWKEYCHAPTLVQHTGQNYSTLGHRIAPVKSFRGEEFDALEFLA